MFADGSSSSSRSRGESPRRSREWAASSSSHQHRRDVSSPHRRVTVRPMPATVSTQGRVSENQSQRDEGRERSVHRRESRSSSPVPPVLSSRVSSNQSSREEWKSLVGKPKSYQCPLCVSSSISREALRVHLSRDHQMISTGERNVDLTCVENLRPAGEVKSKTVSASDVMLSSSAERRENSAECRTSPKRRVRIEAALGRAPAVDVKTVADESRSECKVTEGDLTSLVQTSDCSLLSFPLLHLSVSTTNLLAGCSDDVLPPLYPSFSLDDVSSDGGENFRSSVYSGDMCSESIMCRGVSVREDLPNVLEGDCVSGEELRPGIEPGVLSDTVERDSTVLDDIGSVVEDSVLVGGASTVRLSSASSDAVRLSLFESMSVSNVRRDVPAVGSNCAVEASSVDVRVDKSVGLGNKPAEAHPVEGIDSRISTASAVQSSELRVHSVNVTIGDDDVIDTVLDMSIVRREASRDSSCPNVCTVVKSIDVQTDVLSYNEKEIQTEVVNNAVSVAVGDGELMEEELRSMGRMSSADAKKNQMLSWLRGKNEEEEKFPSRFIWGQMLGMQRPWNVIEIVRKVVESRPLWSRIGIAERAAAIMRCVQVALILAAIEEPSEMKPAGFVKWHRIPAPCKKNVLVIDQELLNSYRVGVVEYDVKRVTDDDVRDVEEGVELQHFPVLRVRPLSDVMLALCTLILPCNAGEMLTAMNSIYTDSSLCAADPEIKAEVDELLEVACRVFQMIGETFVLHKADESGHCPEGSRRYRAGGFEFLRRVHYTRIEVETPEVFPEEIQARKKRRTRSSADVEEEEED